MRRMQPLLTGNAVVDAEHRELFALIDRLELAELAGKAADGDSVTDALDALTDYAFVHFQMEEKLMRREAYPIDAYEEHVAEHRAFAARVEELATTYEAGTLGSVQPIVEFLHEWLGHHIAEVDTAMAQYLRSTRPQQSGA